MVRALKLLLIATMAVEEVKPMPRGVIEWYNHVQGFMGTLHELMQDSAKEADAYDPLGAQKIRDVEYNWLSLVGYYKGLSPLLLDFYFNYYKNAEFTKKNGELARTLHALVGHFRNGATPEAIHKLLQKLTTKTLADKLFKEDGAVHALISDLDEIVQNQRLCMNLISEALKRSPSISEVLQFVVSGSMKKSSSKQRNSEL